MQNKVYYYSASILKRLACSYKMTCRYEFQEGTKQTQGNLFLVVFQAVLLSEELGISCELIDLRTLLPWDAELVEESVKKTGRLVIAHEAPVSENTSPEVLSDCVALAVSKS